MKKLGQDVRAVVDLTEDAGQIICWLCSNTVEINTVSDTMPKGAHQSCQSDDLVESCVGIERNVMVEDGLSQVSDEVVGHGQQQHGVSPHYTTRSSTS